MSLKERFWYKVERAPRTEEGYPTKCVMWIAGSFYSGEIHNLDGTPVGRVSHLHGDAIKDWGASHFMLLDGPFP